ncbi:STAS domain-containing protein [Niallia sp. 03133]|uniref:STAS domain-containing protein n=1 Tax=Niallia sp. 03133 TaxID=3458060 RepID=UPI0040450FA7
MKKDLVYLGKKLSEKTQDIAINVHKERLADVSKEELEEVKRVEDEVIKIRAGFIALFGESLQNYVDIKTAYRKFSDWGKATGNMFCLRGVPLDEALKDVSFYRRAMWRVLQEEIKEKNMSIYTVFEAKEIIDPLLDHALHCFSISYVQSYSETLTNSRKAFLELSVPVVPITDKVAILPIIGDIDTERAQLLMEETLAKTRKMGISHLIMDISGVMIIDTMVANELFKITDALNLLGIETIFSGIRPEIAQTMVSLGLNVEKLVFRANLKQALTALNKEHNMKVELN